MVPAITVFVAGSCPPDSCPAGSTVTLSVNVKFGGIGGQHGTGGVTGTHQVIIGSPGVLYYELATEDGADCDAFDGYDGPNAADCVPGWVGTATDGDSLVGSGSSGSSGPISTKYGLATTGAKWLGVGQDGKIPGGAVYCNAGEYCGAGTTPPLCAVKSPVYINSFGQTGTTDELCAVHAVWVQEIPYGSFTFSGGTTLTFCEPFGDTAIPQGPTAPAVSCTTQP